MNVKDEAAGKRVRCPACQQLVAVPLPEPEEPAVAVELPDEDETAGDDDALRPRKKKKRRVEKKSNKLLYGILGGAGLLLFCCCPVGGGGAWFFFLRSTPEKSIIGKWQIDATSTAAAAEKAAGKKMTDAERKLFDSMMGNAFQMEFKDDHTATMTVTFGNMSETQKATWQVVKSEGKSLTLELKHEKASFGPATEKLDFTVIDSDHIKMVNKIGGKSGKAEELYMKRAK